MTQYQHVGALKMAVLSIQILQPPTNEPLQKREYLLGVGEHKIGSGFDNAIILSGKDKNILEHHVVFNIQSDRVSFSISPKASVIHNGEKIKAARTISVIDGDILEIGEYRMLLCTGISHTESHKTQKSNPTLNLENNPFSQNLEESDRGPLLQNKATDPFLSSESNDFTETGLPLDFLGLYDPFEVDNNGNSSANLKDSVLRRDTGDHERPDKDHYEFRVPGYNHEKTVEEDVSVSLKEATIEEPSANVPIEHSKYYINVENIEQAIEKFLDSIDPNILELELSHYMGFFTNKKKRYWEIYKKQFLRKRHTREIHNMIKMIILSGRL